MVSITLSVPEELKREMESHPEMNWSEVARQAIREKISMLEKMDMVLSGSRMTDEAALELGKKVNRSAAKRAGM